MLNIFKGWFRKYFSNEEAVILLLLVIGSFLALRYLGAMLSPLLASIVIAYILQGLVYRVGRLGVPHLGAVTVVFLLFVGLTLGFLFFLMPLVVAQLTSLIKQVPLLLSSIQDYLKQLPEQYPQFVSQETVVNISRELATEASSMTQWLLSFSLSSIPVLVTILIYTVLVPILVFMLLKDRELIIRSLTAILPAERSLMKQIWSESNLQFANYIRGKVVEILLVGVVTWTSFMWLGVEYAALLGFLNGLSVVIPFIGAAVVTVPVVMVGLIQWGWGSEFIWLMTIYGIIQALDGNVLVPLLFSEVVNLHPIIIIVSVLLFGGLWGLWGVFFAIPLATLFKAIFSAWPTTHHTEP
ncbi:MAG: AI-2E family transporter [Hahellaceae bacterium]|nr:AI-2E family transporter [Hahellaceae bacterium]